ncbi:MAG: membrane dipeptidase [Flavonifractor plautii]
MTDEQFTAIIDHNGVVGLNLYANFLGERADLDTAIAHLEHWLELGASGPSLWAAIWTAVPACRRITVFGSGPAVERLLQRNYSGRWCAPCF